MNTTHEYFVTAHEYSVTANAYGLLLRMETPHIVIRTTDARKAWKAAYRFLRLYEPDIITLREPNGRIHYYDAIFSSPFSRVTYTRTTHTPRSTAGGQYEKEIVRA